MARVLRTGAAVASCAVVLLTSHAQATTTTTTRDTLSGPFLPGEGNTNTDFAITRITDKSGPFAGNVLELALKGKERFVGQANVGGSGSLYVVQPGYSTVSAMDSTPDTTRAWWNFDFSADYGELRDNTNTLVTLTLTDIEGDVFSAPFLPIPGDFPAGSQLAQGSWNIGFGFLSTPLNGFDPFKAGDYQIELSAADVASGAPLGSVGITVRVVPSPGAMAVLACAALSGVRRRR